MGDLADDLREARRRYIAGDSITKIAPDIGIGGIPAIVLAAHAESEHWLTYRHAARVGRSARNATPLLPPERLLTILSAIEEMVRTKVESTLSDPSLLDLIRPLDIHYYLRALQDCHDLRAALTSNTGSSRQGSAPPSGSPSELHSASFDSIPLATHQLSPATDDDLDQ